MKNWNLEVIAIVISLGAVSFTGWQAYEARQARLEARQSQIEARKDWEGEQKLQRELAENAVKEAKRSADAAEKSAAALLASARTFEATSQLRLEPNIEIEARFQSFGSPPIQPRILLWNTGGADALAVSVALKLWVVSPSSDRDGLVMLNVADVIPEWRIPGLPAGDVRILEVKPQATEAPSSHLPGREIRQPFLELVLNDHVKTGHR